MRIYREILKKKSLGHKQLAVLIDPDKTDKDECLQIVFLLNTYKVDYILVGGSLITSNRLPIVLQTIKAHTHIPLVLFPSNNIHLSQDADAVLFLSLISGRNAELLIGQHVVAAPMIKEINLEAIPTGYILINCGNQTSVSYMSNTTPIPYDKPDVAACTAMAGEMLGLQMIYLEGGSGALNPVSKETITQVSQSVNIPLMVGGGIRTAQHACNAYQAGADIIVVSTAIEENKHLLKHIASARSLI